MGAVFAFGSGSSNVAAASPEAVSSGLRSAFAFGFLLVVVAFGIHRGMRTRQVKEPCRIR